MHRREAVTKANATIIVVIVIVAVVGVAYYYSALAPAPPAAVRTTVPASVTATSTKQLKQVRMLYPIGPSASHMGFYVMQRMGYLRAEGVNASISTVVGTPVAVRALLSGSADIAFLALDGEISAIAAGGKLKGFAEWGTFQPFMVVTTLNINSWHDIAGKRIAISGIGALVQQLWIGMLNAEHIPVSDVNFVNVGTSSPDRVKALIARTVDVATVYPEDWVAVSNTPDAKNFHVFLPTIKEFYPFWGFNLYTATTSYIQRNPDVTQGFTTALIKMTRDFYQNKSIFFRAVDVGFPGRYNDQAKEYLWNYFEQNGYFAVNGGLNYVAIDKLVNYTYSVLNPQAAGNTYIHGPNDVVDTSFVKHVLDQLGVFKVNGQVVPWDVPDWYLGAASKSTSVSSSTTTSQPGGSTPPKPPSGYIERILVG